MMVTILHGILLICCYHILEVIEPNKYNFAWHLCVMTFTYWIVGKVSDIGLIASGLFALAAVLNNIKVNLTTYIETNKKIAEFVGKEKHD